MAIDEWPKPLVARGGAEGVMTRIAAELRSMAVVIEDVMSASTPTVDLLEVSRAIQLALVLLADWTTV